MNSEEKTAILKKFMNNLQRQQQSLNSHDSNNQDDLNPKDFNESSLPSIDIVADLMKHHDSVMGVVTGTYNHVQGIAKKLSELQNKKHNVNKLLDSTTAIQQAKRLSYGFGDNPTEIQKNLQIYTQIRSKIFYCDKYVTKIQAQIHELQTKYKQYLEKQLKQSNSENISEIAKILSSISELSVHTNSNGEQQTLYERLNKFYKYLLSLQIKKHENQLFNIPIVGNVTGSIYIFFDIAKQVMKSIVNVINMYRANIIKMGGEESLHHVIVSLFAYAMDGIILEILMRQKKYFQIDSIPIKKIGKDGVRIKDYFNEFSAIQNQIQRLRIHLFQELTPTYQKYGVFNNQLNNCINSSSLILLNTSAIRYFQGYTRSQFDNLLKKSTFIVSLWQLDQQFLQKIVEEWKKSDKSWIESAQGHTYLVDSFSIFMNALSKSFETLNILIISSVVSFMSNNLVQQDSFHAFNQIFDRLIIRFPSNQTKNYTAIILIINYTFLMPNALQVQIETLKIPQELEKYHSRLNSQLKELVVDCEHKCKEVINNFLNSIVNTEWFKAELSQNYKKLLEKWRGFVQQPNYLFIQKTSEAHAKVLFEQQFKQPQKNKKNSVTFSAQSLLSLEKQIRSIASFYEKSGSSVIKNFDTSLKYIEIMLAQDDKTYEKLLTDFGIQQKQKQNIKKLRSMKQS